MNTRILKDRIIKSLVYFSAGLTVVLLAVILGFILIKGIPGINIDFLTNNFEDKTTYVTSERMSYQDSQTEAYGRVGDLGITIGIEDEHGVVVTKVDRDSPVRQAVDPRGVLTPIKKGDLITKVGSFNVENEFKKLDVKNSGLREALLKSVSAKVQETKENSIRLKVVRTGGGIVPMAVTTLYMVVLSILIAGPVGILAAVYLNEYAKPGRVMSVIHFAIENLAGIPSIIYGLFGSLFFVQICKMQYSILAGAMTVSIILLPTIITTTEETLKSIPGTYRESSLGLGATKLQTVSRVVLPNAVPGILVAVLLSVGRIVGESAALLLTAGTVAQIPQALWGNSSSGATLTIKAYTLMKEENDLTTACAIGIVLLALIIFINIASKFVTNLYMRRKG